MIIFHLFGSVPEGKNAFYSIFLKFPFQGVHSNHFSHHFSFPFLCFSAKYKKMS